MISPSNKQGSSKTHIPDSKVPISAIALSNKRLLTSSITMAPPSKLGVAASSLLRLVKEEASYHKEMEQQQSRIKKWESNTDDENAEYYLKQEVWVFVLPARTRLTLHSVKDWRRPRTSSPRSEKRLPRLFKMWRSSS